VSNVSDVAAVQLLMADYAAIDQAGKLNIIGGGISVLSQVPGREVTNAIALVVSLSVPPTHYGQSCSLVVSLERAGDVVSAPSAATGSPQPVRFEQTARFEAPTLASQVMPKDYLRGRFQLVAAFPYGLPLPIGGEYLWRVTLDDKTRDEWTERFVVSEQTPPQPATD
jgi:hypothetical protein